MAMQRCRRQPWIIFLCSVILGGTTVYSNIVINKPQDVIAYQEEALTWNCQVNVPGTPYERVWTQGHHVINTTINAHKYVLANGSLYIDSVVAQRDSGPYRCCVQNVTGILCSQEALLQIAELPQFVTQLEPTIAYQGGVARFQCDVYGVPKVNITWKHIRSSSERTNIRTDVISSRHVVLPNGVLQIHNVTQEDEGRYKCIASNSLQTVRNNSATLSVLPQVMAPMPVSEPFFMQVPTSVRLLPGEDALIECLVEGSPLTITWRRKDGRPIRSEGVSYPGGSNLYIRNVRYSLDNATYRCQATNPDTGQTIGAEARLDIMSPPVITVVPPVYHKVIGSKIRFWCQARGEPRPEITWYHNGVPALIDDFHSHMDNNDYVISQLWWEDEGIYQCEAKNEAGSAIVTGAVTIDAYPEDTYPGPIRNLSITLISSRWMRVTWEPPADLPAPVIAYHLECKALVEDPDAFEEVVTFPSCDLNKLKPFTEYRITVQCFTTKAPCPRYQEYVTTFEDVPSGSPEFSLASESPTSITVTWDELRPRRANGIIIGYGITYCRASSRYCNVTMVDGNLQEYTVHGLVPNSNYSVSMAAATKVGLGGYSGNVTVATPRNINETTPKPPLHLQVSPVNHTSLRVSFQPAPTPPVTEGYKLMVSRNMENNWNTMLLPVNTTEYFVMDLDPYTVYNVHVLGYNSFGDGRPSAQTIRTLATPVTNGGPIFDHLPPPFVFNGTGKSGSTLLIQWEAPLTNKKITAFNIEYEVSGSNESLIVEVDGSTYEVLLMDLKPFTEYTYRIQSVGTLIYPGPFSPTARAKTLEDKPSDPPSAVEASPVDSNTVAVSWRPPARPNGIITRYTVMYQRDPSLPEDSWECEQKDGSMHQSTIKSLTSDTKYYFKVRAGTQAGDGPPTDAVAAQTLPVDMNTPNPSGSLQQGILIGVCLSLVCICICTALITYRFRHVCWRRRAARPPQCSCRTRNGGPCVHYHSNSDSQRVYMSVPNNDEMTPDLPVLTRYETTQEGTPSHLQNGHGPNWNHANGQAPIMMNGYGPPGGNGHGPPVGNGHHGLPRANGHGPPLGNGHWPPRVNGHGPSRMNSQPGGLVGWQQKREGHWPHMPPDGLKGHEEDASYSGSSVHGSGLLHHSQEYNSQELPPVGTEHQEIPSNSSTSQLELSGTKSVTSLQSNASWQPTTNSQSSQDSITHHHHLPPTSANMSASITPTPSQGHNHISGVHSPGGGVPSSDGGGMDSPCHTSTSHKLPPARRVDPQRVLPQGHVTPVSCGRGSPPAGAQDPQGVDPWERWSPPEVSAGEAEDHQSEPNRTMKTCTV